MLALINSIHVINLRRDCWELSECTCKNWSKYLKCDHVIAVAFKLKLCSFSSIAYSIPISHKGRRGQPAKTASALIRQPSELQNELSIIDYPSSKQETIIPVTVPEKKKRGRPAKNKAPEQEKSEKRASKRLKTK